MSVIVDAIKRISVIAEQRNWPNIPGEFLYTCEPYPPCKRVIPEDLSEEQLELVDNYCNSKPKLTLSEIEELAAPYRFSLPQEIYDLYQIGNGCLPIGDAKNKNWDSVYNYCYFPSMANPLWTLADAMSAYRSLLLEFNPELLPLCSYGEDKTLYMLGSKKFQETVPLIWIYDHSISDDIASMEVLWPSLTNMMLAYAERSESLCDGSLTENKEKIIYQKYSSGNELGWYEFSIVR
ncbi:SMI1/KNR4 family protein [Acaryochloris sp. IP29b_bin.148]|uniref:SMI1/KNR4 family protein n=1 Tax=Acaryochloris sp. IP29b_bin.148 TaxID=2969218 RepID=UPI002629B536|nr:SMI1/KNR4 family protein [Acaryochloris sp. IP29b_bin.148]